MWGGGGHLPQAREFNTHNSRGHQSRPVSSQRDDSPMNNETNPESRWANGFPGGELSSQAPQLPWPWSGLFRSGAHRSCDPPFLALPHQQQGPQASACPRASGPGPGLALGPGGALMSPVWPGFLRGLWAPNGALQGQPGQEYGARAGQPGVFSPQSVK